MVSSLLLLPPITLPIQSFSVVARPSHFCTSLTLAITTLLTPGAPQFKRGGREAKERWFWGEQQGKKLSVYVYVLISQDLTFRVNGLYGKTKQCDLQVFPPGPVKSPFCPCFPLQSYCHPTSSPSSNQSVLLGRNVLPSSVLFLWT